MRGSRLISAAILILMTVCAWSVSAAHAAAFSEAYGTFADPIKAIDGDRSTYAQSSDPYRGEYFLIIRFPKPSLVRNFKIRYTGAEPKNVITEMGSDAVNWIPYELGEKTAYLRIRIPAKPGEIFKIAEVEANSEEAPAVVFAPTIIEAANIETTAVILNIGFTKPVAVSLNYGLSPVTEEMKNFREYPSYQTFYQIKLLDLIEGLDYYVRVKATSAEGDLFVTEDTAPVHFRLRGTPPLRVISQGVGYVGPLSFSVIVQTNIPSHSVCYFGEQSNFTTILSKPDFDTVHIFEFKDLWPQRLYAYMPVLTDHRGMNLNMGKQHVTTAELNVARGKRVIAGTFTQLREPAWQGGAELVGDTVLQRVTNGNLGYFKGMAHSGDLSRSDQYAVIDLGREFTLDGHTTVWRALAYPYYYEVYTSLDNTSWEKQIVMTEERIAEGLSTRSGDGDPLRITGSPFQEGVKARYVKLLIPAGTKMARRHRTWTNVDLAEIMIFPGGTYDEIKQIAKEIWRP